MNLSRFPTIVQAKNIGLQFLPDYYASQIFFNYDYEIDNCILKGIRLEYNADGVFGSVPSPYSLNCNTQLVAPYKFLQFGLQPVVASYFGLTLVDKNNNLILQNYPLNGLNNPTTGANANTNYIRRFNSEINLQKSFVSILDKTVIPSFATDAVYINFTFYYKPKN